MLSQAAACDTLSLSLFPSFNLFSLSPSAFFLNFYSYFCCLSSSNFCSSALCIVYFFKRDQYLVFFRLSQKKLKSGISVGKSSFDLSDKRMSQKLFCYLIMFEIVFCQLRLRL